MKWSAYNSGKVNTTKKIAKMVEADDIKEEHRSQIRTHTPEDIKKIESKWVSLTDEERLYLVVNSKITEPNDEPIKFGAPSRKCIRDLVLLIEAKLKEKNHG